MKNTKLMNRLRRFFIHLFAIGILGVSVAYTSRAIENQVPAVADTPPEVLPLVSVLPVVAETHQVTVSGTGEAQAQYEMLLTTEVSGRVKKFNPALARGQSVGAGTVLVQLDALAFDQQVASAKQNLAEAKVSLLQEQREAEQARASWQRSGLTETKASPLLMRVPQLRAAKNRVANANAQLKVAQQALANTRVKVPFNAIVVERLVVPGQYLQAGDAVARLYSIDRMDVRVSLAQSQWTLLPKPAVLQETNNVVLTNASGQTWQGQVTQVDQHIDAQSRQRSLLVSVQHPLQQNPPLMPGTFLSVSIPGVSQHGLLSVPASSLTRQGEVWYVDSSEHLQAFDARVVFQQAGALFIDPPQSLSSAAGQSNGALSVVASPLLSYVVGQKVTPVLGQEVSKP